jgi:hypothetical protein
MPIKKYIATADNTITNAYTISSDGTTVLAVRGTGSNAGAADILEVFSQYGTTGFDTTSQQLSRILINFPISTISSDRTAGTIPATGSVNFFLKMHNAKHTHTVPEDFTLMVYPVSRSWEEGTGLDLVGHTDSTKGIPGSNWISGASSGGPWTTPGGDYISASNEWNRSGRPHFYSQSFSTGFEDLEIDITMLVEDWLMSLTGSPNLKNYGVGVQLTSSQEAQFTLTSSLPNTGSMVNRTSSTTDSYYTKRFFARSTEFFYKKPAIEARWDSAKRDDRGGFYYSSSLAPAAENLNTLYLYNYVRGRLRNIPAVGITGSIMLSLCSGSTDNTKPDGTKLILSTTAHAVTGGWVATGIYSASVAITAAATPIKTLYDVWWSGSGADTSSSFVGGLEFSTGSIKPYSLAGGQSAREPVYYMNITNLKNRYTRKETARFNLYVRNKYWEPTIYTKANATLPNTSITSASYSVYRCLDAYEALPHGTGTILSTGMSYDVSGNYFDLDMSLFEAGYAYAFKFAFYDPELSSWVEQDKVFKFRVEEYDY